MKIKKKETSCTLVLLVKKPHQININTDRCHSCVTSVTAVLPAGETHNCAVIVQIFPQVFPFFPVFSETMASQCHVVQCF